ncbi:LOW QUALITY PROTEIN: CRCB domain-containing protein, partial [Cephalotus follicularis]
SSSAGSSLRRPTLSLSDDVLSPIGDDIDTETVSEAGDSGSRAPHSGRHSGIGSFRLSAANGRVFPIAQHNMLQSTPLNSISPVPPSVGISISPLSIEAPAHSEDKKQETEKVLSWALGYISYLIDLSFFGILGVLTRYLLQKLFGPRIVSLTSDESILYLDLPSNMVSLSLSHTHTRARALPDIQEESTYLAIGLTTGYLGSLTTFSGNQKMLDLSVDGKWMLSVPGVFLGLFPVSHSIIFGIETAWSLRRQLLTRLSTSPTSGIPNSSSKWRLNSHKRHLAVMVAFLLMLGALLSVSGTLLNHEFNSGGSGAQPWLACTVAPPGVWIRRFLARFNGRGLGSAGILKWVPFGTLTANVSAACIMAALSTVKKVVNTKTCDTIATGMQFGFLGCLSTVSTFMAEFNTMRESKHTMRAYAYAYALTTIGPSFVLGILIYSVPVWIK